MNFTRRQFFAASAAGMGSTAFAQNRKGIQNRVVEWSFASGKMYPNPMDVELDVEFTGPGGKKMKVPAFWAGDNVWRVRFAPPLPGSYSCRSFCSDSANSELHGITSKLDVAAYAGANPLYRHGALKVSANRRHFEHADGTPFFWLADTWWMAMTERMQWPEDIQYLANDRKRKGFSVIQLVAGLYPDMDSFDPRGRGDAGFPWTPGYGSIQPAWWDEADLRIQHLVEIGLMPCVLGCWGYYLLKMGPEKMKLHWRYIVARWAAYPVVWALAGEGTMAWYLSEQKVQDSQGLKIGWTEVAKYVRSIDAYSRLVTVHPARNARTSVNDPTLLDFDMLQTGHGDRTSLHNTVRAVAESYAATPRMPVIDGEVCYEGILGQSPEEIQRLMFWASILNGACGHTYGADGIWQVNLPGKPYGPSPHGNTWGNTPWKDAAQLPGSGQLGRCAALLKQYPWWQFEPHPEWVEPNLSEKNSEHAYAAGIPGRVRFVYIPTRIELRAVVGLESGEWRAALINPSTTERHELGSITPQDGRWLLPKSPEKRDWLAVLEKRG